MYETRRRVPWRWIILAVLLLALAPVGWLGYNLGSTLFTISKTDGGNPLNALPVGDNALSGTVYVLVMGSDQRLDRNGNPVSGADVPHSDTMILAALDTDHHQARLLSVPRDLLVTIPGFGPNHRINEAFTIGETRHLTGGGPDLARKTMEKLTGLVIPYYAVTSFDGFRQTVNTVGGVTIDVDRPINDHDYPGEGNDYMPIYVPAGLQQMDGERALEYVRSRHDDPLSDFGRNQRQQKFIRALTQKLTQPSRIGQIGTFLDIIKSSVRTNLKPGQIISLAGTLRGAGKQQIRSYLVGPGYVDEPTRAQEAAYGAVLIPNRTRIDELVKAFVDGSPPPDATPSASPG